MELKVKPQEVEQFARNLHQWSVELQNMNSQVKGRTEALQQHWNDPQFRNFAEIINGHNANLQGAVKTFEELSSTLMKMARLMAENVNQQQQMIDSLRRR